MVIVLTVVGMALVAGFASALIGWRGRRIDDHPLCRRCMYDLSGTPAVPKLCPECGSSLTKPRATRIGNRRRRRAMLTLGLAILAGSLTVGGFVGWATYTDTDWNPYKPFWLLRLDLASSDPGAQAETLRRLTKDELSTEQTQRLIKDGLDWQTDKAKRWDPFWGDIIELAWQQDNVSDAQIEQYLKAALEGNSQFIIRRKIRSGEDIHYLRRMSNLRSANRSAFRLWTYYEPMRFKDTDIQSVTNLRSLARISAKGKRSSGSAVRFDAPPGKYTLIVECHCNLIPASMINQAKFGGRVLSETDHLRSITVADRIERFEIPIEVVEPNAPVVELVDDPTLTDAISKALSVITCKIVLTSDGRKWPRLQLAANSLPMAIGFDVIWRLQQEEWNIGGVAASRNDRSASFTPNWEVNLDAFPIDVTAVDIVLRSNPLYCERTTDIERIWQGEIVFPNQPLTREFQKK